MSSVALAWQSVGLFLVFVWLLQRLLFPGRRGLALAVLGAALMSWIPILGHPARYWLAALSTNVSVPLVVLLIAAVVSRAGLGDFFRSREWRAAWIFGALSALLLYPSALGLGLRNFDSYTLGWPWLDSAGSLMLFLPVALVSALLVFRGNRFGWVLAAAGAGYLLRIQESHNFWDYLVDPLYAAVSLLACGLLLACGRKRS